MDRLEGSPVEVLRPYADWMVFELERPVKRGLDWYTVEGPFVLRCGDRYVCFYSGGRWENPNYGIGYALADHPLGPWVDDTNAAGPTVLTTVPGEVIGPGHNSVVVGPDLVTPYVVYHGWDPGCTARYPRIDPLVWVHGRPRCVGPSSEPRPAPALPEILVHFDEADPGPEWNSLPGEWLRKDGALQALRGARLDLRETLGDFVIETSVRRCRGGVGVRVGSMPVVLETDCLRAGELSVPLSPGFEHGAWHRLLVCRSGDRITATVDEYPTVIAPSPTGALRVALMADPVCAFGHVAVSRR
jgi:hypothetical protein